MTDMTESSAAIWDFALSLYRQPEVAALCLELQERYGANTNLVLWCQWLTQQQVELTDALLTTAEAALKAWHHEVVVPLRRARQALKRHSGGKRYANALYSDVQRAEIDAEQAEYRLLSNLALLPSSTALPADHNLRRYLHSLGVQRIDEQWLRVLGQPPFTLSG